MGYICITLFIYADQRLKELEEKRDLYQLEVVSPGLPPRIKVLPADEHFPTDFKWDIARMRSKIAVQSRIVKIKTGSWKSVEDLQSLFRGKYFPRPASCVRYVYDEIHGMSRGAIQHSFI